MVNLLKICSRIRSSFISNQNVFIYKRQIRKITNNLSILNIDYMPGTILNSKDYENLWTKNIEKLKKENSNLDFNDFKKICFTLNQTIDYSKNKKFGPKTKKLVVYIITSLFEDPNSNIAKSFIENPKNWSILFDLISDIEELFKDEILATKTFYQCPTKDFRIHSIDHILQSLKRFTSHYVSQLDSIQDYKIDLNFLKFNIDIIKSIYTYFLSNKTELTLEDEYVVLFVIKANLFYVESFLFKNKSTLKYILSQTKNETNKIVFDYLDQVDSFLSKFMKYYSNFDSISFTKKSDYLEAFSYFEKKWLNSCNWLLDKERPNTHKEVILYEHSLRGSIHFERMDYFEKLFKSLHELIIDINLAEGYITNIYNSLFRDFLNIQFIANNNENLENNLTILFNVWSYISYCPNKAMLNNLQLYLDYLNNIENKIDNKSNQFTDKSSKWLMRKVNVNLNGKVKDTDFILERASFNNEDINIISNLFKKKILNEINLREDILDEFNKINTLLETSKFDIIVDGMNVCYLRYHKEKFDNIFYLKNLINLKEKNKNVLIFLRDHVFYKNIKAIKEISKESNNKNNNRFEFFCINSFFEDDKFFLYSAFKSGINTYIVSNDHFKDQIHFLGNYGVIARDWMFNHKIKVDRYQNKLKYPPLYKLKCNQVNENKWFLPCLLENLDNKREHYFVSIEKTNLN